MYCCSNIYIYMYVYIYIYTYIACRRPPCMRRRKGGKGVIIQASSKSSISNGAASKVLHRPLDLVWISAAHQITESAWALLRRIGDPH